MDPFLYTGSKTTQISFPLGGIGSGCIGLAGNGRLIDWEIFNRPNKGSVNGFSHFAVRVEKIDPEKDNQVVDARMLHGALPAREAFKLARCVVVPSRAEAMPYIILETVAAKRPLIATRVGGIPEIFGRFAPRLIEPGHIGKLTMAMEAAMDQPAELQLAWRGGYASGAAGLGRDPEFSCARPAAPRKTGRSPL